MPRKIGIWKTPDFLESFYHQDQVVDDEMPCQRICIGKNYLH